MRGLAGTVALAAGLLCLARPAAAQDKPATPAIQPISAKLAFINLQIVFNESDIGKQGQAKVKALNDKLFAGLTARDKEIQGLSDKIKAQRALVEEAVVASWSQDLARMEREAQFARQEAQIQSESLQQQVLADFSKRIRPIIDQLRVEKGLQAIVGVQNDPGGLTLLSVEPGVDLSQELVKRLNATK
jgi:Skp family chaperone for outer membrane proteins